MIVALGGSSAEMRPVTIQDGLGLSDFGLNWLYPAATKRLRDDQPGLGRREQRGTADGGRLGANVDGG
jgi:hypothetical protein